MTRYWLTPNLKAAGKKVHSQNDEDGVIDQIFSDIPPKSKYFVEFGVGPNWLDKQYVGGIEGNCVLLEKAGWSGLFMDGGIHPAEYKVKQEFITATNINGILRKHRVPKEVDIVSIDVDGQDLWIWLALDLQPILVIIEMNPNFTSLAQSVSVGLDLNFRWDGTKYYGASLGALVKIGYEKGYKLVYANGVNAFFVRQDILANPDDFKDDDLFIHFDQHMPDHFQRHWLSI